MIFLDNASTTKIHDFIIDKMSKLNNDSFYNPSALYSKGVEVNRLIANYRDQIKVALKADMFDNVIFTGSATEANNMAIRGIVKKNSGKILVSQGEHPSVYNVANDLVSQGHNVEFIKLTKEGYVDFEDFKSKMDKNTSFVSIMHVSNETGAINDIKKLVEYAKSVNPNVIFHSDGVQALGKIKVNLKALKVDLYTISAHKINGMKGVGALYIKNGINLKPLVLGGGQEFNLRSGTENILGIMTLVEATNYAVEHQLEHYNKILSLKQRFIEELDKYGIDYVLHSFEENSPYIIAIGFQGVRAETLLHKMDEYGVLIGNGSACSSKKSGNRILSSMGVDQKVIESSVRISFGIYNDENDVVEAANLLNKCIIEYKEKVRL